ncbi:MAG: DUF3488 and transglutaminase-like domain-containing protein [Methylococcales bacterium]|nr:DUF3488 and transglutaminase-like domain-containing protein [Methylococcales bacterium]
MTSIHAHYHRRQWLGLLLGIGLIAAPHIQHLPPLLLAFAALIWVWRVLIVFWPGGQPGRVVLLLLTLAGLALLISQHHGIFGRDAGTGLFLMALMLKLMELQRERDVFLVVVLAFIVAATQFLFDQSLWMGLYIITVCVLLLTVLSSLNHARQPLFRQLRTTGLILLQAVPLTVVLFVLFPRLEAPRWMLLQQDRSARTGLSDSMEPGSITNLGLSDELVFRVRFEGPIPPMRERYWRGPVFSRTDGKRWTQLPLPFQQSIHQPLRFQGVAYRYTLMMEPQDKPWVFALDMPAQYPSALTMKSTYQLYDSRDLADQRQEYQLISYSNYQTPGISERERRANLYLPGHQLDGELALLIQRLQGGVVAPERYIGNVLNHFREQQFYYTLTPPALDDDNPIKTFLLTTRMGFCSHYAAAFVYLMRAAGVPARVVTGYQGGVMNDVGGFLEVRQANAHAWSEVWLEGRGWVRYDPTAAIAPERVEQALDIDRQIATGAISYLDIDERIVQGLGWLAQARQLWGSVDYTWQRWIINYRSASQEQLLARWGIADLRAMLVWLGGLLLLFTLLLTAALLWRGRRQPVASEVKYYQQFCAHCARLGAPRRIGEGPWDYGQRLQRQFPEQAKAIAAISEAFVALRYHREPAPGSLRRLRQQVKQFRGAVYSGSAPPRVAH